MRKIFSTKIVATSVTALLAVTSLSACGGTQGSKDSDSATKATAKITFMTLGAPKGNTEWVKNTLIPEFKKKTGIDVVLQTSDWGSGFQKVTTSAASNSLPDVFMMGAIWLAPLASKGVLMPLDEVSANWPDKEKIQKSALNDCVYDGKLYALPFGADFKGPVYNKPILDAAGVTKLPTTWDEFKAAAQKVKATGKTKAPIWWNTDKSIGFQQSYAVLMMQNNAPYWGADGKPQFDKPNSIEALKFLQDSYKEGLANVNLVYSGNGLRPVAAGDAAMSFGGSSELGNAIQEKPELADDLVVGPPLKGPNGEPTIGLWTNKFGIAKSSKNKDAAWKFLTFLLEKENVSKFDQTAGVLPIRTDLVDAEWLRPSDKLFLQMADKAKGQPASPIMMQLGKKVNESLDPLVRFNATPEQTGANINQILIGLLGK